MRALIVVAALLLEACGAPTPRTTSELTGTVPPTVDVPGTVQAAVSATVAASKPAVQAAASPVATPQPTGTSAARQAVAPSVIVPSPTIAQEAHVTVTEFDAFTNTIGDTVVIGMVANEGTSDIGAIQIAVSFLGSDGTTVAAAQALVEKPNVLKAGARAPWEASTSNPVQFKQIKVQVQAQPMSTFLAGFTTQEFVTEGVTVGQPTARARATISGQVRNTGAKPASLVQITAAIYGDDGKLFDVEDAFASLQQIAPGQTSPFQITVGPRMGNQPINKYDLFIEGTPG